MAEIGLQERTEEEFERYFAAGGELLRQNRNDEARKAFNAALEHKPDDVKTLALLGLACFRMGDFAAALPVYQRLVAVDRNDASYWLNLGLIHLKLSNPAAAIRGLQHARELDPSQTRVVGYLGLAYARNGQYSQAYQAFLQAGEQELAQEMEKYLSPAQRAEIQKSVVPITPPSPQPPPRRGATELGPPRPIPAVPAAAVIAPGGSAIPTAISTPIPSSPRDSDAAGASTRADSESPPPPPRRPSSASASASPARSGDTSASASSTAIELDDIEEYDAQDARPSGSGQRADGRGGARGRLPSEPYLRAGTGSGRVRLASEGGRADSQNDSATITIPQSRRAPSGGEERGVISLAVEQALPSAAAAAGAARAAMGHRAPVTLSEFATARLIRPDDGDHTFETGAGGVLIIRVRGRVYARTEGVNVTGGELAYEVATRHVRGSTTRDGFSSDGRELFIVSGDGHMIAVPLGQYFSTVALDDDILYLREDLVFAFEDGVRWENGNVPGSQATIPMVQFRGQGELAFRSRHPLLSIKLAAEKVLYIDAHVLAGWIGRVMPRAVVSGASMASGSDTSTDTSGADTATDTSGPDKEALFVECTGEGIVLIEEEEGDAAEWARIAAGSHGNPNASGDT